ncbi:hypothetical protein [Jiella mangrovi]|uniref:Uncharacterized protein n=1 Tax=Jiella mangrovi TaxID=2821407 RepID=A0ABS4BDW4_9HYPH|nr:hypothetical protein [Jiella mangrovi]MBP0614254.1 hypothetical protein [Jiella mangrovi]
MRSLSAIISSQARPTKAYNHRGTCATQFSNRASRLQVACRGVGLVPIAGIVFDPAHHGIPVLRALGIAAITAGLPPLPRLDPGGLWQLATQEHGGIANNVRAGRAFEETNKDVQERSKQGFGDPL